MSVITFSETLTQHQARIGLSARRTKNLRRILVLKRQGLDPRAILDTMGPTNATWADTQAASADLAAELHVVLSGLRYEPDAFQVAPEESAARAELNRGLSHGSDKRARAAAGYLFTIPYGYRARRWQRRTPGARSRNRAHHRGTDCCGLEPGCDRRVAQ